jgi:hypothetical protein
MWSWSLNWGEVTSTILVGTCPMTADDIGRIAEGTKASALLSLQHDDCLRYWHIDAARLRLRAQALGLVTVRCPMRDFDIPDQRRQLPQAIVALAGLQRAGHRTYVHCTAGLGRAPLTVLAYLVMVERLAPDRAIGLIKAARPDAVPAWEAFHGCRKDLLQEQAAAVARRAYEIYERGGQGSADADWVKAEADVLQAAVLAMVSREASEALDRGGR